MIDQSADRHLARVWALEALSDPRAVILDTETTGLDADAEIVQISIIDMTGAVLLDTLIRPTRAIPPIATAIHGITDAMVADAPTFMDIDPRLVGLLGGRRVIAYNADFDRRMIEQSDRAALRGTGNLPVDWRALCVWDCAMEQYAAYVGDYDYHRGGYRWQRLPHGDHSALGDARATLRLIKAMAGVPTIPIAVGLLDQEYATLRGVYGKYDIGDILAGLVADLAGGERCGSAERQQRAHDWFTKWRLEQE